MKSTYQFIHRVTEFYCNLKLSIIWQQSNEQKMASDAEREILVDQQSNDSQVLPKKESKTIEEVHETMDATRDARREAIGKHVEKMLAANI